MNLKSWASIVSMPVSGIVAGGIERVGAVTILYDGAAGTTPNSYTSTPYLNFGNMGGSQTASGGVTNLDTSSSESVQAGYSNYNSSGLVNSLFPVLDNNAGYTLSFTMKVNSQTNNGSNGDYRAGFSAIVLGSDKKGIELGFRNPNTNTNIPDIFSQNSATFNTSGERNASLGGILSNLSTYNLTILGNGYTLTNGGNTLLSGLLRDYTSAVGLLTDVYRTPNFIFLGDNTISAGANVDIQSITLTTTDATAVPEPSSMVGIGLAIGFAARLRRKLVN